MSETVSVDVFCFLLDGVKSKNKKPTIWVKTKQNTWAHTYIYTHSCNTMKMVIHCKEYWWHMAL